VTNDDNTTVLGPTLLLYNSSLKNSPINIWSSSVEILYKNWSGIKREDNRRVGVPVSNLGTFRNLNERTWDITQINELTVVLFGVRTGLFSETKTRSVRFGSVRRTFPFLSQYPSSLVQIFFFNK
jgi:hypothetical protein